MFLGVIIASVVIVAGIGVYLYRLLKSIDAMREATFKLDDGDLSQAQQIISTADLSKRTSITVFGNAFRSTLTSLNESIRNIYTVSTDVAQTTSSIKNVSNTIDDSTNSLLDSIEEISSSVQKQDSLSSHAQQAMQQMSIDIQEISLQMRNAVSNLNATSDLISRSSQNATDASVQVESMMQTVQGTADNVRDLTEKYTSIEAMVNVIQDIADQTNLLSLNASIEAARAGEQGKGFAIVADEVRKLAELTKDSAEDIRLQIEEFKVVTQNVFVNMLDSTKEVQNGAERVKHISTDLTNVLEEAGKVRNEVHAVESITSKIEDTALQVSTAIAQSNEASQYVIQSTTTVQAAATAQEEMLFTLKDAIDHLTSNVESLEQVLHKYKV
ncbi:MAG: methyl-accepting chemotaxis protein [Lysinibacillus sp.]